MHARTPRRLVVSRTLARVLPLSIAFLATAFLATAFLAVAPTAAAQDTWTDPHPGMRRLHRRTSNQNVNALVVDLCRAGVSVRSTATGERRRTPSSFGALVGAQAAVNGDFFSFETYSTDGLSMHAGAQWPGTGDHGYVGPVAFGIGRAEIVAHEVVAGPEPWMREIVSGHPTILVGGVVRDGAGDPLCTNRHPRTILGLSADRATLYLAVVDGRASTRIGMTCREEAELMRGLGASDAVNMDGGGSSAMWIGGLGVVSLPSDGSQRTVANHLAIYASGSGAAAHCPNQPPRGYLDAAACDSVRGWAQDPDAPDAAMRVHLYYGGPAGTPGAVTQSVLADVHRDDLCAAIGSCAHGFVRRPPRALMDGVERPVHAYGIDTEGGHNPELASSPRNMRCDPPVPPDGVLRHVTSPDVMTAWAFSFDEVAGVGDAAIAAHPLGRTWPTDGPDLARAEGEPAVYVVDGAFKRHVPSADVMAAWGFSFDAVRSVPRSDLDALLDGPPWRAEPFLLRGDGPAVYVVDDPDPPVAPPDAGLEDAGSASDASIRDGGDPRPRDAGGLDAARGGSGARPITGGCAAGPGRGGAGWLLVALAVAWRARRRT